MQQSEKRCTGIVKFYNRKQGFGFITLDSGKGEIYVHRSALQDVDPENINAGDHVALSVVNNDKGPLAAGVTLIRDAKATEAEGKAPPAKPTRGKATKPRETPGNERPVAKKAPEMAGIAAQVEPTKAAKVEGGGKGTKSKAPTATSSPAVVTRAEPAKDAKMDGSGGRTFKQKPPSAAKPPTGAAPAKPAKETRVALAGKEAKLKSLVVAKLADSPVSPAPRASQAAGSPTPNAVSGKDTGFQGLGLLPSLLRAVKDAGYEQPTPIQSKAIPLLLAGKDLLGCAQTGTGKTAAFALPILQHLSNTTPAGSARPQAAGKKPAAKRPVRALILSPTRELAIQIDESFVVYEKYTGLRSTVIFGGVGQDPQVKALQAGVDVLVATPGRLLDLMGQGFVSISNIEIFVLDEADRMLDMGFIHDVRRVIKELPRNRQTMLFSATIPAEIVDLAQSMLHDPVEVRVSPEKITLDEIAQSLYFVPKKQKVLLLINLLLKDKKIIRTLVFTRTKHGANQVVKKLVQAGIPALAIHGNKSQTARQKALGDFKQGDLRVLVATDVASRGIDVDDISHVIQFDLPNVPETYVHRIGRTGRMGAIGSAIAFCDEAEKDCLKDIEKLLKKRVPVVNNHPFRP